MIFFPVRLQPFLPAPQIQLVARPLLRHAHLTKLRSDRRHDARAHLARPYAVGTSRILSESRAM
jgi:hypothetical protein